MINSVTCDFARESKLFLLPEAFPTASLKQAKENVTNIDNYVKDTVSKMKERYQLSETSATNGPQKYELIIEIIELNNELLVQK